MCRKNTDRGYFTFSPCLFDSSFRSPLTAQAHAEALARQKETRAPLDMIAGEERGDIASHTDGPV